MQSHFLGRRLVGAFGRRVSAHEHSGGNEDHIGVGRGRGRSARRGARARGNEERKPEERTCDERHRFIMPRRRAAGTRSDADLRLRPLQNE
jgi:hypothetical protein